LTETVTEFSDDEANEEDLEDLEEFGKDLESSLGKFSIFSQFLKFQNIRKI
jgi:hypothetical protein